MQYVVAAAAAAAAVVAAAVAAAAVVLVVVVVVVAALGMLRILGTPIFGNPHTVAVVGISETRHCFQRNVLAPRREQLDLRFLEPCKLH